MAVSYVNKSAFASGTAGITVGAVPGVVAGDIILLFVESAAQGVVTPTNYSGIGSPNFVEVGTANTSSGCRLTWFYRVATGADTTTSIADTGDHTCAIKLAYRGTQVGFQISTNTKPTTSITASFPEIITTADNSLIVLASALNLDLASTATTGTPTNANLTGLVERHDQTVASGFGGGLVILEGFKATAGNTGTTTATLSNSTTQVYATFALPPKISQGDLDASESGSDTFEATGTVENAGISGTLAATEVGSDTLSATGTVADPSIVGTLAATEVGADTFTSTGDVLVEGALAATEVGKDTFAATAKNIVKGSLAVTEIGSDTFAATAKAIVKGSLAVTEVGSDTFAATAKVIVRGSLAATETGSDVFAATGAVTNPEITGVFAATEVGTDTFTATGDVIVEGSSAVSEVGSDVFCRYSGEVADRIASGNLAATEVGSDTLASTGTVTVEGSLAATELPDTFAATGQVFIEGSLAATEVGSDTFAATADLVVQGSLAVTEVGSDTFAATAKAIVNGSLDVTEVGSDTLAAAGKVVVIGDLDATEEPDTFASTGSVLVDGSFAAVEVGSDIFVGSGDNVVGGIMSVSEVGSDTLGRYVDDGYADIGYVGYQIPGRVLVQGTVGATEVGSDVFAATGFTVIITGDLAATEQGSDTFQATGDSQQAIEGRARAAVFTPASEITVRLRPHKKVAGHAATPTAKTTSSARILVAPHKAVSAKSRKVRLFKGVAVSAALRGSKVQTRPVSVITGTTFTVPKLSGVSTWSRDVKITTSVPTIVQFKRNKARIGTAQAKVTTVLNPTDQELMAMAMVLRQQYQAKVSKFRPKL